MTKRTHAAIIAISAFVLSACGGGSKSVAPILQVPTRANAELSLPFGYDRATIAAAQFVAPATFGRATFDVLLRMRDGAGLEAYARSVSDPRSSTYRQFLTPAQIADRFAASAGDQERVAAYFRSFGLTVEGWKQRASVEVTGDQKSLERAFGTHFGLYRHGSERFVAPVAPPVLAANVPALGSTDMVRGATFRYTSQYIAGGGASGGRLSGYSPQQIAAAFDFNGAYRDGYTGSGITVGIIGTGPISTQTSGRRGDLEAFKFLYGVTGASAISVISAMPTDAAVNGATGFASPPPVTGPCVGGTPVAPTPSCNPEDGETQIDTEQIGSLARDSNIDYYLSYNPNDGCGAQNAPCSVGAGIALQGLSEADQELQNAISRNSADILSLSYGGPEIGSVGSTSPPGLFVPGVGAFGPTGLDPTLFAMLAAEGIAVFVSSGDSGAQQCGAPFLIPGNEDKQCVSYPATDPSVVSVGGVTTPLDGAGRFVGPVTAWGIQTQPGSGTGGGVSAYFPLPPFQKNVPGVVGATRNQPDVSLEADPTTGVAFIRNADSSLGGASQRPSAIGGTSVAAPEMAAMWALVLQACKNTASCAVAAGAKPYRLGNPNSILYGIDAKPALYAATFLDVTFGNNGVPPYCGRAPQPTDCPTPDPASSIPPSPTPSLDPGFSAGVGYDNVTGLGVPFARALIHAVVGV